MRNKPRTNKGLNPFTRCFNKYVIKKYKLKGYLGKIEACTIDHVLNLETTKYSFNLEDDGC